MSLINDALKRISKKDRDESGGAAPPLPPLEPAASRGGPPPWLRILVLALMLVCAGAIAWIVWSFVQDGGEGEKLAQTGATNRLSSATQEADGAAGEEEETAREGAEEAVALPDGAASEAGRGGAETNAEPILEGRLYPELVEERLEENEGSEALLINKNRVRDVAEVPLEPVEERSVPDGEPPPVEGVIDSAMAGLNLQGIFYRRDRPTALINGKSYRQGDEVNGLRVVEVKRQGVVLSMDGRERVLELPSN